MNNLVIDIGNTAIKYAIFGDDDSLLCNGRIENHADIQPIKNDCNIFHPDNAIVASTADLSEGVISNIRALTPHTLTLDHNTPVPIENLYHTPHTLGTDRLAAAIAAYNQTHSNTLIIDIGTAITIDFVNADGQYLGGNISPGMHLRFETLHEHTAHLPLVSHEGAKPEFGVDTETAIRCGVINGINYEIQGYISEFSLKYHNLCIFLTGGDQIYFDEAIKNRIFADKYLVLKGLNEIIKFNLHCKHS